MKFLITTVFILTILFSGAFPQNSFAEKTGSSGGLLDLQGSTAATEEKTGGTAGTDIGKSVTLQNPLDENISSIPAFFQAIIDILLIFAIPFIVFFIIYAGFLYVSARGNAETISKAHKALLYALIGGVLILGANVLLDVIAGTVTDITG